MFDSLHKGLVQVGDWLGRAAAARGSSISFSSTNMARTLSSNS